MIIRDLFEGHPTYYVYVGIVNVPWISHRLLCNILSKYHIGLKNIGRIMFVHLKTRSLGLKLNVLHDKNYIHDKSGVEPRRVSKEEKHESSVGET